MDIVRTVLIKTLQTLGSASPLDQNRYAEILHELLDAPLVSGVKGCPFRDCKGAEIFEGDWIQRPHGERGRVVFIPGFVSPEDSWQVYYQGDPMFLRLSDQVGPHSAVVKLTEGEEP